MTANREPSNQGFEIDRDATVCTASRRFLALKVKNPNAPAVTREAEEDWGR
jgi:hypothetical protein